MRAVLHIVTKENDAEADRVISCQRGLPELKVETATLTGGQPDYRNLLEKVFAADSVAVW
jgi:hypothetical protein